jgi:CheY-like chemotaxis protein
MMAKASILLASAPSAPSSRPPPAAPSGRRGRVYVIDDDEAIVRAVDRLLRAEHDIIIQTSSTAALEHLSSCEDYDIIFCDITMPRLNGVALYRALLAVRPALAGKLVFMTGGALDPDTEEFLRSTRVSTIAKPFTPQGLRSFARDHVK